MFLFDVDEKYEEGTLEIPDLSAGNDLFMVYNVTNGFGYVPEKERDMSLIQVLMIRELGTPFRGVMLQLKQRSSISQI